MQGGGEISDHSWFFIVKWKDNCPILSYTVLDGAMKGGGGVAIEAIARCGAVCFKGPGKTPFPCSWWFHSAGTFGVCNPSTPDSTNDRQCTGQRHCAWSSWRSSQLVSINR